MNEKPITPIDSRPVFIEVPKPINAMSALEKDFFIEQIIQAFSESISEEERE
jgi:hypothetical protein